VALEKIMKSRTEDFLKLLKSRIAIDEIDWQLAKIHSDKWQLSLADALIDLHFANETAVAHALAELASMSYIEGESIRDEEVDIDSNDLDALLQVGALPLSQGRLAVCNPQDDHRGFLGNSLCEREMLVTERSTIYKFLRSFGLTHLQTVSAN
jgi:hypothetical protein